VGNTYCIFYGWLCDDPGGEPNEAARRIAAVRVPLLIASFWTEPRTHRNLSPRVLALMRDAGIRVFAYVSTHWGGADVQSVKSSATEYLDAGVDGVFLDETHNLLDASKLLYYRGLAQFVRSRGGQVIANPGVPRCGADVMSVADYVMVEHAWRELRAQSPWCAGHAAERFMGVSSNEESGMGYAVDRERAIADTREAWAAGVGWHAATDRYTRLPEWFEDYVAAVRP
jgi:hypothetical protein